MSRSPRARGYAGMCGCCGIPYSRCCHPYRLGIGELGDAEPGKLAPITAALDATERQPRVRGHHGVHEAAAGVDLTGQSPCAVEIIGPQRGTESEARLVGH